MASSAAASSTTAPLFSFGATVGGSAASAAPSAFNFSSSSASAPAAFSFASAPSSFGEILSGCFTAVYGLSLFDYSFLLIYLKPLISCLGGTNPEGNADEGEEDEEPKKFVSEVAVSEESGAISFKAKAKFRHLSKGSWDEKGVGTLMLRVRNDGSNKPFATFTTEAVRVIMMYRVLIWLDLCPIF